MNLYFDTEFTGLHKDTTLISIGIVAEDGRKFYAEFTDYDREQCDDWIKENVIANLLYNASAKVYERPRDEMDCYVKDKKDLVSVALRDWLSQFNSVQFVSDVCHYDFVLLVDIFGSAWDLPRNVSPVCHDISQDIANHYGISDAEAFDKSREEIVKELCGQEIEGRKHNALYDAEVIKAIYSEVK